MLRWRFSLRRKEFTYSLFLFGSKINASNESGEFLADFERRDLHPLSPESVMGLFGRALRVHLLSPQASLNNSFRGNMSKVKSFVKRILCLLMGAHLHFGDSLFSGKAGLWPGCKGVARKKHRRERNFIRRPRRVSAERGGPIGRPAGRPYIGITLFLGKERLARPVEEVRGAS